MTVGSRKAREFERRGQDILDAALALFKSDDWEDVTVDQIARQADVAKGTIYKHFASKNEIYARLSIGFQRRILASLQGIDRSLPVPERFRQFIRCAWQVHLSSKELHRVFLYCSRAEFRAGLPPTVVADMQAVEATATEPLRTLLREGIEQGVFPAKPLALLMFGANAAFWGAIQLIWSGHMGDVDHDRHLAELTDFILAGLMRQGRDTQAAQQLQVVGR